MFLISHNIYIHIHVFRPAQDSSVWFGLTSREQLMSPECSKHQVLSLAKMLVVNEQYIYIYTYTYMYISYEVWKGVFLPNCAQNLSAGYC